MDESGGILHTDTFRPYIFSCSAGRLISGELAAIRQNIQFNQEIDDGLRVDGFVDPTSGAGRFTDLFDVVGIGGGEGQNGDKSTGTYYKFSGYS